jgi:1-acyl-sn-glycerol-3-phosphate acyltransferase
VRARYSARAWSVFERVFRNRMSAQLDQLVFRGLPVVTNPAWPVLLISNHVSWWDGFLLRALHARIRPEAPLYTVMLESRLRQHPFFRLLGALPLQPGSPASLLRLLRTLHQVRAQAPDFVLSFFPQGRIYPSWKRPLGFQSGAALLSRVLAPVTILPVGLHIEPLARERPTAFITVGPPLIAGADGESAADLEAAVTAQLDFALNWMAERGEDAARGFGVRSAPASIGFR